MELLNYIISSGGILLVFFLVYQLLLRRDTFFMANRHFLLAGIIAAVVFPFIEFTTITYIDVAPLITSEGFSEVVPVSQINNTPREIAINWWQIATVIYILGIGFMTFRFLRQLFSLRLILKKYPSERLERFIYIKVPTNSLPFSFFNYIVYNPEIHSKEELQMILKHEQIHVRQWHSIDIILANILLILQWMNPLAWLYKKGIEENLEFIADSEAAQVVPSVKQYQLALVKVSVNQPIPSLTNNFYQSFTRLEVFGKKIILKKPSGQVKKRIVMLNKSTSKKRNIWKVSIVLPLLAVFLWSFNVKEVIEYRETGDATITNSESTYSQGSFIAPENPSDIKNVKKSESTSPKTVTETAASVAERVSSTTANTNAKSNSSEAKIMLDPFANSLKDIVVEITKNTTKNELEEIKKELEADGFKFNYSDLEYNNKNELTGITISYRSKEGNSGSYSVSSEEPINSIIIKSGANGLSVRSSGGSGNRAYINQGNGADYEGFDEQREDMKKRREEMNEKRKEIREEMHENRKEIRDEMKEEMKMRRDEMKEEMIHMRRHSDSNRVFRGRRVDSLRNFGHVDHNTDDDLMREREHRDRSRNIAVTRSKSKRDRKAGFTPKGSKTITKNSSDSDLERIKNEFSEKGISFTYRGVKRNDVGEIVRIKLKLSDNKGSTTNSSYSGDDDEPIGTLILSAEEGTVIRSSN